MIDCEEVAGKEAMNVLNAEFGRNRAIFFQCDVANNSEFDGNYIFVQHNLIVIEYKFSYATLSLTTMSLILSEIVKRC